MTTTDAARLVTIRCPRCQTRNRVDLARLAKGPRCAKCQTPIRLDHPVHISAADLEELIRSAPVTIVVDFYADWCGPCRAIAPNLETLAARHTGQVLVLKLDTDRYPELAARFGIRGIPTLIAFAGGREVKRQVGMADLPALEALAAAR